MLFRVQASPPDYLTEQEAEKIVAYAVSVALELLGGSPDVSATHVVEDDHDLVR